MNLPRGKPLEPPRGPAFFWTPLGPFGGIPRTPVFRTPFPWVVPTFKAPFGGFFQKWEPPRVCPPGERPLNPNKKFLPPKQTSKPTCFGGKGEPARTHKGKPLPTPKGPLLNFGNPGFPSGKMVGFPKMGSKFPEPWAVWGGKFGETLGENPKGGKGPNQGKGPKITRGHPKGLKMVPALLKCPNPKPNGSPPKVRKEPPWYPPNQTRVQIPPGLNWFPPKTPQGNRGNRVPNQTPKAHREPWEPSLKALRFNPQGPPSCFQTGGIRPNNGPMVPGLGPTVGTKG